MYLFIQNAYGEFVLDVKHVSSIAHLIFLEKKNRTNTDIRQRQSDIVE